MYKIYINDIPLYLQGFEHYHAGDAKNLTAVYINKPVTLLQYIDTLEKVNSLESIQIFSRNLEKLKNDFFRLFEIVEASGGLVFNEDEKLLAIFRRGHWDLPKGKLDSGETIEAAAVREVMEETGISDVSRHDLIGTTYHSFRNRHGKRVMKISHWFLMTAPNQATIPQTEEDIDKVEWVDVNDFTTSYLPIYPNIKEIVRQYLKI